MEFKIISKSIDETLNLGFKLANNINKNVIIYLNGDLASGKTHFTKGIAKGLGVSSIVSSPTFTILKNYQGKMKLHHIDAYRLEDNLYDLGFEELVTPDSVVVVEWPKFLKQFYNYPYIEIDFKHIDDVTREIIFRSNFESENQILKEFYDTLY